MKQFHLTLFFILGLFCFSCSNDDGKTEETTSTSSEIDGDWEGTYSGTDNGSWEITINDEGNVTGTAISNIFNQPLVIIGLVNDQGEFEATVGAASSGAIFTGTFADGKGSGTWVNASQNLNGNWSGTKK